MEKEVKFKYVFQKDYNPVHVNGVYGGVSPSGDLVANFYYERQPIPNSQVVSIDKNGQPTGDAKNDPEDLPLMFIRYVNGGISMNPAFAAVLHEWLGEQLQKFSCHGGSPSKGGEVDE